VTTLALRPSDWIGLAVIAGARTSAGNGRRLPSRDRGAERNMRNDLIGCVGEYAAIVAVEDRGREVIHTMFDCATPVAEADLIVDGVGYDAKAKPLEAGRDKMILARRSVATATRKNISAFVPVLSSFYSHTAVIGRRIPIADAAAMPLEDFGYGAAHWIALDDMCDRYFDQSIAQIWRLCSGSVFVDDGDMIMTAAMAHGATLGAARISEITAGQSTRDGVQALALSFVADRERRLVSA